MNPANAIRDNKWAVKWTSRVVVVASTATTTRRAISTSSSYVRVCVYVSQHWIRAWCQWHTFSLCQCVCHTGVWNNILHTFVRRRSWLRNCDAIFFKLLLSFLWTYGWLSFVLMTIIINIGGTQWTEIKESDFEVMSRISSGKKSGCNNMSTRQTNWRWWRWWWWCGKRFLKCCIKCW